METLVEIEGHELKLTNLEKIFYPKVGWTKAHVIDYYRRIAPMLLPHLEGRAVTLKRYPNGVDGPFFYEKECPAYRPEWVKTTNVWSETRGDDIHFCMLDTLPSLLWAANLADLEIHTYLGTGAKPNEPTSLVFDLDPGAPADAIDCARVALSLREVFRDLGMESFVKSSGSKGLQMYVPLNVEGVTFEETKPLARAVGEIVERADPDRVTTNMSKALRKGKVLIDWSQNDDHKTTVCVYSLRAKDEPTVSTPLEWREVQRALDAEDASILRFRAEDVLERVEKKGDLFAPVLSMEQALPVLG